MRLYFVATDGSTAEYEVIRECRPDSLLLSYWYFRNKGIEQFIDKIGYKPEILLDSGAFSAWTKGRNISPIDYMQFIDANASYIDGYFALDVIGDDELSKRYYEIMRYKGYDPIPVFHYGGDVKYLDYYVTQTDYVALGGAAKMRSKTKVAEWCTQAIDRHPDVKFHLLGSSSKQITEACDLHSFDSSTWIMMAVNGYPKTIPGRDRESKIERAKWQMRKLQEEYKCG